MRAIVASAGPCSPRRRQVVGGAVALVTDQYSPVSSLPRTWHAGPPHHRPHRPLLASYFGPGVPQLPPLTAVAHPALVSDHVILEFTGRSPPCRPCPFLKPCSAAAHHGGAWRGGSCRGVLKGSPLQVRCSRSAARVVPWRQSSAAPTGRYVSP